jgi:hypothetical protein
LEKLDAPLQAEIVNICSVDFSDDIAPRKRQ